jgi:hypothetical protein
MIKTSLAVQARVIATRTKPDRAEALKPAVDKAVHNREEEREMKPDAKQQKADKNVKADRARQVPVPDSKVVPVKKNQEANKIRSWIFKTTDLSHERSVVFLCGEIPFSQSPDFNYLCMTSASVHRQTQHPRPVSNFPIRYLD